MSRKPNPPPDDKEQAKRFIDSAKALEADESGRQFEAALKIVVPPHDKPKKAKTT